MLQKMLWLSLAGACGTVSRFALCEAAAKVKGGPVPLGTFTVNILGSFLFGLIYALAQRKLNISPETRVILLVGFMGAFTTFSSLAFETAKMLRSAQWMLACGNVIAQITLGIAALGAGVMVGRAS
ncbi:MAG: CrcB family protein [Armatimonadota bacterium]